MWAGKYKDERHHGGPPKKVTDVLQTGDIVRLARNDEGKWKLSQLPTVQGALIALDPEDGAIKAEVGGFSFSRSKFNRVVQAARQPGSSFKPFFYSAAFEHGFTPASIINDAPIVFADPSKPNGLWTPQNDDGKFDGPMRLREAMVVSKNLVSVRLLDAIGVRYAREFVTRFGFTLEQIPDNLSMALGTASVSPLTMARGVRRVRERRISGRSVFHRPRSSIAMVRKSSNHNPPSHAGTVRNGWWRTRANKCKPT